MKKEKKIIVGIFSVACLSLGALGTISALPTNTNFANAEAVTMKLDTLGNLAWNEVNGATGYTWSYAINGGSSSVSGGTSTDNTADVGVALKAAAQDAKTKNTDADDSNNVAQASVAFTVTPVVASENGESQTWEHTFEQYIDYNYTTHDFSAGAGQSAYFDVDEPTTGIGGNSSRMTNDTFIKNDLFVSDIKKVFAWYNALLAAGFTEFKLPEEPTEE